MAMAADSPNERSQHNALHSPSQHRRDPSDNNAAPTGAGHSDGDSGYVPRPKRIACVLCRRRKLRCDGRKPSCGTCARLGHECAYEELRKKSGPKRGYVKQLEARLAQVETLLKTHERSPPQSTQNNNFGTAVPNELTGVPGIMSVGDGVVAPMSPPVGPLGGPRLSQAFPSSGLDASQSEYFGWDMISLGLEEPAPNQAVTNELNQIYFQKIHPSVPILHPPRHLAAMNLAPRVRPPICLQYITWCHAASVTDKYSGLHELFYQRARKYAELEEMKGLGEGIVSVSHCQTWLLIATYEFRMMFFPRAWLSVGKAARLAFMMGLNRLDGPDLEVKKTLPPARDWTEKEERRRVFWMTFCVDRYASVGTGWPVVMDERDITTNLPATEEAFIKSKPESTARLTDVLVGDGISTLSSCAGLGFMACLFGRNVVHLHRPDPHDNDHDLNGLYWQRHRSHDNILLHFTLAMPNHLRLPAGVRDPNVIFCNMAIHTSTICLHQAAIYKAEKNKMPDQIITESKRRCIVAADQISNIMKMISHMDLTTMNPFMSFCIFVAARVFVQYLKSRPDDTAARSSLQFLFSALDALKNKNPLTESFLVQLEVDIQGTSFSSIRPSTAVSARDFKPSGPCGIMVPRRQCQKQDEGLPSPSTQTIPRHDFSMPASLLTGSQQTAQQPDVNSAQTAGDTQDFNDTPPYSLGSGTILDLDIPQEFNGSTNTLSGVPTLAVDSSATGSTSDSAPSKEQNHHPSIGHLNQSSSMGNSGSEQLTFDVTAAARYPDAQSSEGLLAPGLMTPLESTEPGSSIPMPPPNWDFASASQNGDSINAAALEGIDSLNEAQWAQLLSSTNWDAWRNQG
ncbi:putative C6 transcription factor Prf [Aspergillus taichungensis]|uniref:Putative C6 transcription factor Prf n=1 Tax=Aspergillus taichungensis TaxID=482145 RepID=A0A2J5I5Z2_9EURO|nr:putative C6 transcription factor Prf [Aspergillus taichungensis]